LSVKYLFRELINKYNSKEWHLQHHFLNFKMMQRFVLKWRYRYNFCEIIIVTKDIIYQRNCEQRQYRVRE
jgi:hypothetical protein